MKNEVDEKGKGYLESVETALLSLLFAAAKLICLCLNLVAGLQEHR